MSMMRIPWKIRPGITLTDSGPGVHAISLSCDGQTATGGPGNVSPLAPLVGPSGFGGPRALRRDVAFGSAGVRRRQVVASARSRRKGRIPGPVVYCCRACRRRLLAIPGYPDARRQIRQRSRHRPHCSRLRRPGDDMVPPVGVIAAATESEPGIRCRARLPSTFLRSGASPKRFSCERQFCDWLFTGYNNCTTSLRRHCRRVRSSRSPALFLPFG
jgi:hypothetical protein